MSIARRSARRRLAPFSRKRRRTSDRGWLARHVKFEFLEQRQLLATLSWSSGPTLPAARTDAVAVVAPDKSVRLLGGAAADSTAAPVLRPGATSWTSGFRIDTVRNDLGAVRLGSAVILYGGTGGTEGSDEVLSYDYRAGDSQDLAKMASIRYDFGFAADGSGRAYAIGGIGVRADGEVWSQVERYDPTTKTWKSVSPLPVPLHGSSAIGDGNGHIFVFGGSTTLNDSGIQGTTYKYDIATDKWSTVAPMPTATRDSAAVIDNAGNIYVLGGMTKNGATAKVQKYNPSTNAWTDETPLPQAVYSHAAVLDSQSQILVVGGFNANGTAVTSVYHTQRLDKPDSKPAITSRPVTNGSLDRPYRYDVDATGNPLPAFSLVAAPQGMTIDGSSGVINWQPAAGQVGDHTVTVRAANRAGHSDQTFSIHVVADSIAPTAPTNLKVDSVAQTTADLSWSASTDAVGVDHYSVFKVVHRRSRWRRWTVYTLLKNVPGNQLSTTITGLTPYTHNNFVVRAVDAAGNVSKNSNEVRAFTLKAPDLQYYFNGKRAAPVQSRANAVLKIQLISRANPGASFSVVSGPTGMTVDANGLVKWTPGNGDLGKHSATFRATNSLGSADLTVPIEIVADAPVLSISFAPNTNGRPFAVAGVPFKAKINDASNSPPTFSLVQAPNGMTIDANTGMIGWTPLSTQAGTQTVIVRGTNSGGNTDFTFSLPTRFTGAVTGVSVTDTTQLHPVAHWTAPTGVGSDRVDHYAIKASYAYKVGRRWQRHTVNYTAPATSNQVKLTGLNANKTYTVTVTPVDAAGNPGLTEAGIQFRYTPLLPSIRWTINGKTAGTANGIMIAGQSNTLVLKDSRVAPSKIELVSGPAGLSFDPATNTATWTPGAADVTTRFNKVSIRFKATNTVGSVNVVIPVRVLFSSAVTGLSSTKYGNTAIAKWNPPAVTAKPVAGYEITMLFKVHGRNRSRTWTVGPVTQVKYSLVPTGAVWHRGVIVTPLDADGNRGLASNMAAYGKPPNDHAPTAVDDTYQATEDVQLSVDARQGVLANDHDPDNKPFYNPMRAFIVGAPSNGTVGLRQDGSFVYTPKADFFGTDSFTYRVHDGRFWSNTATVTINVAAVNDPPKALDDHYQTNQDQPLSINAAQGVLANDSDAEGDPISVRLVSSPAHGTVTLAKDGSFVYTPATGFSGADSFTYVANDGQADSRVAKANINVKATQAGTKFYVVDLETRRTYEYKADGGSVEDYALAAKNRKPRGATASKDGSKIWVLDKKGRIYLYDANGGARGNWAPTGPKKFEGIATDDRNIWIVDRELDRVFYYAGAASRTAGTAAATSSFPLAPANRNATGITTDGTHLWVVNNGQVDRVFKYKTDGTLVGSWKIDPANAAPTGITVDPSNVRDIWIVDRATDKVYQYNGAAARTGGQQNADVSFALNSANVNPQGIADPPAVPQSWQNPFDAFDVNDDRQVTPRDALALINALEEMGARALGSRDRENGFLDVNGDDQLSPADVLAVITALEEGRTGTENTADLALAQVVTELDNANAEGESNLDSQTNDAADDFWATL